VTACWERSVRLGTAAAAEEVACWDDMVVVWVADVGYRERSCVIGYGRIGSLGCREDGDGEVDICEAMR